MLLPETAQSIADKNFTNLSPLTPGSKNLYLSDFRSCLILRTVHGYSLLRTQLNNDYFHDLYDQSLLFDVAIESHRAYRLAILTEFLDIFLSRYRNGSRRLGNCPCLYYCSSNGG